MFWGKYENELDQLRQDSEMPIEDLLDNLPRDMLARISGQMEESSDDDDGNSNDSDDTER